MQYNTNKSQGGGSSPPFNENSFVVARSGCSLIQDLKLELSLGHSMTSTAPMKQIEVPNSVTKMSEKWMEGNSGSNFRPQMAVYSLLFAHNTYFCPGQNNIMIHVYTTTTT